MTFLIRPAVVADRAAIDVLDTTHFGLGNSIADMDDDLFAKMLPVGPSLGMELTVAEDQGGVIGFAATHPRASPIGPDMASVNKILARIAVDESRRREGVGAALLADITMRVRVHGDALFSAHVPESAVDFYESQGWTVVPKGKGFAFVEAPTLAQWEQMTRTLGPGHGVPRRAMTVLRAEEAESDVGFDRQAFLVLDSSKLLDLFTFPLLKMQSNMAAMMHLMRQVDADPSIFRAMNVDVSRTLYDMFLVPRLGQARADAIKRARN